MARTDSRPRLRLDPDARREAILRSAAAAFAERPYAEVTLADIAEGARASTPLVYRYFHGKEDLYAQVVRESVDALMERQARAIDALPDGAPVRDRIRTATIVYLDHIAAHPGAWAMPLRRPGRGRRAVWSAAPGCTGTWCLGLLSYGTLGAIKRYQPAMRALCLTPSRAAAGLVENRDQSPWSTRGHHYGSAPTSS